MVMKRFSISMDNDLVAKVDDAVAREGGASRSAWLEMVAAGSAPGNN